MVYLIFLLEVMFIVFWVDIDYHTSNYSYIQNIPNHYNSYYSVDVVGNSILILKDISENEKIDLWKESYIKKEMLSYFPDIQLMQMFFKDRIEDNGKFKSSFLHYMTTVYNEYIAGNLTKEGFEKAISNPPSTLIVNY